MISPQLITRHYWLHIDGDVDERVIHLYEHCFIHQLDRFLAEHYPIPPYPASYVGGESFLHYIYLTVDCCTDIVPAIDEYVAQSGRAIPDTVVRSCLGEVEAELGTRYTVMNWTGLRAELDQLTRMRFIPSDQIDRLIYTPEPDEENCHRGLFRMRRRPELFEKMTTILVVTNPTVAEMIIFRLIARGVWWQITRQTVADLGLYPDGAIVDGSKEQVILRQSFLLRRRPIHRRIKQRLSSALASPPTPNQSSLNGLATRLKELIDDRTLIDIHDDLNVLTGQAGVSSLLTVANIKQVLTRLELAEISYRPCQEDDYTDKSPSGGASR